ncbi:sensor histidine kinase [Pedobacter nototheniae]|uniref:sensor histidine kinase n=1 Tax=Pedobacter nototheniae TaxID=2488994 RepID=UPI00292E2821|nr:histidine kinase [Pedobacter nototheniae]
MKKKLNISLYWQCQIIGWSVASLYWSLQGWVNAGFRWDLAVVYFASDLGIYIFITHLYRNFAQKNQWQNLPLQHLIRRLVIAIPVMAIIYTAVTISKIYLIRSLFSILSDSFFPDFFIANWGNIFIAGIRLMAIWLLAYHLYHYAKREIRLSVENARLELSFKQAQLDNLSAQLNPHFLFNALNTIKSLVFSNPDSAGRGIDLLSELLRNGLYSGDKMMIRLNEEIDLVRDYLELEQLRMEERLSYDLDFDVSLSGIKVPRLSIQILVENAVKHGVSLINEGGKIEISVSEQSGFLNILVSNPGLLLPESNSIGIGLHNLKERLDIGYNGKASVSIHENEGRIEAMIKIPAQ